MSRPDFENALSAGAKASVPQGTPGVGIDSGAASEFGKVMEGLVAASSGQSHGPSLMKSLVTLPGAVYEKALAFVKTPTPEGMSLEDSMNLSASKRIMISEAKTFHNITASIVKSAKKDIETLMNNK